VKTSSNATETKAVKTLDTWTIGADSDAAMASNVPLSLFPSVTSVGALVMTGGLPPEIRVMTLT